MDTTFFLQSVKKELSKDVFAILLVERIQIVQILYKTTLFSVVEIGNFSITQCTFILEFVRECIEDKSDKVQFQEEVADCKIEVRFDSCFEFTLTNTTTKGVCKISSDEDFFMFLTSFAKCLKSSVYDSHIINEIVTKLVQKFLSYSEERISYLFENWETVVCPGNDFEDTLDQVLERASHCQEKRRLKLFILLHSDLVQALYAIGKIVAGEQQRTHQEKTIQGKEI